MAHVARHSGFAGLSASAKRNAEQPGLLRRIYDSVVQSHERRANRDVADFIERSGGRLTDDLERQMTQRFMDHQNFRR